MSFEVFMQCFSAGRLSGVPASAVRAAFGDFLSETARDEWRLRYDDANVCDLHITDRNDLIEAITIDRPCGDARLWDSVYRVLKRGPWVLYFPAPRPPLVMADASLAEQLPSEMRSSLGPICEVRSGLEIQEIIHRS